MLPVNQITPLFSEEASLKRFKPWWETVIDWLCCSVIFIAVVAWSMILEGEASGVKCIQKDAQNETFWNSVYAKYCSRRCALELFKAILVYYPYVVSAQGIILIFCQIFWLKIPNVCSKMEAVDIIVKAIEQTNSEAEQKEDRILAELRLAFLLKEKTKIVFYLFLVKSILLCLISSLSFGLIIGLWFNGMELWNDRSVECHLSSMKDVQDCPALSCNIGAGRHTFVIICINLVILALLLVFSIVGALYLLCCKVRGIKNKLRPESSTNGERQPLRRTSTGNRMIKAYPGNDLYVILGLLDSNLHDGGFMIGKIRDSIDDIEKRQSSPTHSEVPKSNRSSVGSPDTSDKSGSQSNANLQAIEMQVPTQGSSQADGENAKSDQRDAKETSFSTNELQYPVQPEGESDS